jgi:hypothetical protein
MYGVKIAKIECPKGNLKKLCTLQNGKKRCARCRYEFIPHKLPLTFSRYEWEGIVYLFLMEQSSNSGAEQTGFEQRQELRELTKIQLVMTQDIPEIFSGTVELDETYLGGQEERTKNNPGQGNKTRTWYQETTSIWDPLSQWYCLGRDC